MVKVAPSLLSADFARLDQEIAEVERAGADLLHLDVMDGRFVPNLTFGPLVVEAVNRMTDLPLDVHLMIVEPLKLAPSFARAGADLLVVHHEAVDDLPAALAELKKLGVRAGFSLNPQTPLAEVEPFLPQADQVLVMSVNPGFGGQKFLPESLEKVRRLRDLKLAGRHRAEIAIDGGINRETAGEAVRTGAEVLVAGAAVFKSSDKAGMIRFLKEAV
jgi:ribulose-phosphate 3-epimerase